MEKVDVEHVVSVGMVEHEKAVSSTAYTGDHVTNIHHKSSTERKLVLKAQVLIAVLAALIYFVAYLVSTCSPTLTLSKLGFSNARFRIEVALAMLKSWICKKI